MITYILVLLWALFIVAILASTKALINNAVSYDFQNFGPVDIPYITMDIQGNTMNMIVDTGCGVSLLNKQAIENCELLYRKSGKAVSLSAITDDKVNANAITLDFNIGKKTVTEDFFIHDVDDFGNFNKMYGINIHGLLGSSFFDNNNCRIDYKKHTLTVL